VTSRSISLPDTDDYRLNNLRLHRHTSLGPKVSPSTSKDSLRQALTLPAVQSGKSGPRMPGPEPRQQSTAVAALRSRPSSIATPISTRAISGRANPIPTAAFPVPSTPLARTVPRPAGLQKTSSGAWNSRSPAPMPTAPRRCVRILIPCPRRRTSPGRFSKPCRDRWKGRIELQAACLFGLMKRRTKTGSTVWPVPSPVTTAFSARSPTWSLTRCTAGSHVRQGHRSGS
jgi:hypothetical protein